ADPRQRVADQQVDDPGAAERGLEQDNAGRLLGDVTDDRGLPAEPGGGARGAAGAGPAWAPSTPAPSRPSQATYMGSMPSSSEAPRTSVRTGMASSVTTTLTLAAVATSLRMVATPPRVASRRARTPVVAPSRSAIMPFIAAVSETMSASMPSSPRASMIVTPWSPIVPDTITASPGCAVATPSDTSCSITPSPAVLM